MFCPECQARLEEHSTFCPACGFSLEKASLRFGAAVNLHPELTDPDFVLRGLHLQRTREMIREFHRQFPQMNLTLAFLPVPREYPLTSYAFWLFNRGNICREAARGEHNYHVFLAIDKDHRRAALAVGYALEPFLTPDGLRDCLRAGKASLARGKFRRAATEVVEALESMLHEAGKQAGDNYGLNQGRAARL